jgi:hypothetical protein
VRKGEKCGYGRGRINHPSTGSSHTGKTWTDSILLRLILHGGHLGLLSIGKAWCDVGRVRTVLRSHCPKTSELTVFCHFHVESHNRRRKLNRIPISAVSHLSGRSSASSDAKLRDDRGNSIFGGLDTAGSTKCVERAIGRSEEVVAPAVGRVNGGEERRRCWDFGSLWRFEAL